MNRKTLTRNALSLALVAASIVTFLPRPENDRAEPHR